MRTDLWLAFVAASLVIGLVPGPGVAAIVGYAIGAGRRVALASVAGLALGNLVAAIASLVGIGAILATSALAFTVVKWIGAGYLLAIGALTVWRARDVSAIDISVSAPITPRIAFYGNVAVGAFHPKTILFLAAFAPQFLDPAYGYAPQAAVLAITFCVTLAITDAGYALLASGTGSFLRTPRAIRWSKRAGGGALIFAGLATATLRR